MIIVSQDKETIVNFNNVDLIQIVENRDNFGIEANVSHTIVYLGNYFKQNRAKEVLQEILEEYSNWEKPVYEMPKE